MKPLGFLLLALALLLPGAAAAPDLEPLNSLGSPGPAGWRWQGLRSPAEGALVARAYLAGVRARTPGALEKARSVLEGLLATDPGATYGAACAARALAEGAEAFANLDTRFTARLERGADALLAPVEEWLVEYGRFREVHGFPEPLWIRGRPDVVSQVLLAEVSRQRLDPRPERRDVLARFAEGLVRLRRGSVSDYPFQAHLSLLTGVASEAGRNLAPAWIVERAHTVEALAEVGRLLGDGFLVESAEREALGMGAHLVISGDPPYAFAPRPERRGPHPKGAATLAGGMAALHRATGKPLYRVLAEVAAAGARLPPGDPEAGSRAAVVLAREALARAPVWDEVVDLEPPFTYQVMEAEEGKAVGKTFEAVEIRYPGGTPGRMAVVGRENMFWMRFDVDREEDYLFYLVFMRSTVSGGLVSVKMRIDGGQIFQVALDGASDTPYLDMERVAGPRRLRQGPHNFGIRFSGLLMTRPAVLDSVVVQPLVERRYLERPDGRRLLLLKSFSESPVATRVEPTEQRAPVAVQVVDAGGSQHPPRFTTDRRGHRYLEIPAGGVAALEW